MDEIGRVAELLGAPASWGDLSADVIEETLVLAAVGFALGRIGAEQTGAFYERAMLALDPQRRAAIVVNIGRMCERVGRTGAFVPSYALFPFIYIDDDYTVVSTAALEMAQTMAPREHDPLTGPRTLIEIAAQLGDLKKAWTLAGVSALADSRVSSLLVAAWLTCSPRAQSDWLKTIAAQRPTVAMFLWFSALVEQQAFETFDVLAALTRIARAARGPLVDGGVSGGQVCEMERAFPSWSVSPDSSPVTVTKEYQLKDVGVFAPRLVPCLQDLAALEGFPRLIPLALDAFEVRDKAFDAAVQRAVRGAGLRKAKGVIREGLPVAVSPGWARSDALLEWGILNPFGPTRSHLVAVPIGAKMIAVVFAMHNPSAHECLVVSTIQAGDREALSRGLVDIVNQFKFGDVVLMRGLPQWVTLGDGVSAELAAELFQRLYTGAQLRGGGGEGAPAAAIEQLHRLRADPEGETHRQFTAALSTVREATGHPKRKSARGAVRQATSVSVAPTAAWSAADFSRWIAETTAPEHVAAVEPNFVGCWTLSERMQKQAGQLGAHR